jgi:hypothetical protein
MSEPATGRDARPRVNRGEIALWVIGAVLVAVSLAIVIDAMEYLSSPNRSGQPSVFDELVQIAMQLAPSVLTAGLVSIILAIVVRALRANVTHPAIAAAPSPVVEVIEIVQPSPMPAREPAQTDHSLFMRPSKDRAKQGG